MDENLEYERFINILAEIIYNIITKKEEAE